MKCLLSSTGMSFGSFMVLVLVSIDIRKNIFTGYDAVAGCCTTKSDWLVQTRNCWNNRPMSKVAWFATLALKAYAQTFWCILLVSDSCSRNSKNRTKVKNALEHSYFKCWATFMCGICDLILEFHSHSMLLLPDRDREWSTCCCSKQQGKQFGQNIACTGISPRSWVCVPVPV